MIQIQNLHKEFLEPGGKRLNVLDGINLTIQDGDIYGIMGISGAGKSTLMRILGLLEAPTSGTLWVDGTDIFALSGQAKIDYHKKIGYIFQGYNLLMQKNVQDNVAFPLTLSKNLDRAQRQQRAAQMLEVVGLCDKALAYPATLSGGQKQRVAIARALATNPQIILCDEPTSALDSITTDAILSLLQKVNAEFGVTVVIITHEIGVVKRICNKVAVLHRGKLLDNGRVQDVQTRQKDEMIKNFFEGGR